LHALKDVLLSGHHL